MARIAMTGIARAVRRGSAALAMAVLLIAARAEAAELVLFQAEGCPYCEAWDREVGSIYPLTAEARELPLRRVDVTAPRPADLIGIANIRYTPTFVVLVDGREVGRIVGYQGQDQFWGLLGEIVAALPRN